MATKKSVKTSNNKQQKEKNYERTATSLEVTPSTITQDYGERVIDVGLIPYMRSKTIQVTGVGLKPSTQMYVFFDGEDVNEYCTPFPTADFSVAVDAPVVNGGKPGDKLITNADGDLFFTFRIPSDDTLKFRTGSKVLRVTDSLTNSSEAGLVTSAAESQYNASGISQTKQSTIVSIKVPVVTTSSVTETKTVTTKTPDVKDPKPKPDKVKPKPEPFVWPNDTTPGQDPIAQSFRIISSMLDGGAPGAFITKFNLYFQSVGPTRKAFIDLREMDSAGQVTRNSIPDSFVTLDPADVVLSEDGSLPTEVVFDQPIYVLADTDYALVIRPNDETTRLWVAKIGQADILTGAKVNVQMHNGTLLASSNDITWEPIQGEDLKFEMFVANFTVGSGQVTLSNKDVDFFTANTITGLFAVGETVYGEDRIAFSGMSGGVIANNYILTGATSNTVGQVVHVDGTNYRVRNTTPKSFITGENVTVKYANSTPTLISATIGSVSTPVGSILFKDEEKIQVDNSNKLFVAGERVLGAVSNNHMIISTVDDKYMNTIIPEIASLQPVYTSIDFSARTVNASYAADSYFDLDIGYDFDLSDEKKLLSASHEDDLLSNDKSILVRANMTSYNKYVSPVLDTTRMQMIYQGNKVNNDSTGETNPDHGNAVARYISKKITLGEDQDAEDLKVFITGYKPPGTQIQLYFRAQHADDSDLFEENAWEQMEIISKDVFSDRENKEDFKEYEYVIPDELLTGANDEYEYTNSLGVTFVGFKYFAFKIVLLSPDTSDVPRCRDFRSMAVQK